MINEDNALRSMIPPHYTSVLEPCDLVINKSLEDRLKKLPLIVAEKGLIFSHPGDKLLAPKHNDVLNWLKIFGKRFHLLKFRIRLREVDITTNIPLTTLVTLGLIPKQINQIKNFC